MNTIHYTDSYLLDPQHQITVALIGMGGSGSQMLTGLARMNEALIGLGHPGLHVRGYDPDVVTEANIGRQLFSPADVGYNKAVCLISRCNRFFGLEWEAVPELHGDGQEQANITITCVDTAAARLEIGKRFDKKLAVNAPTNTPLYWLDLGNGQHTGQVVLGTVNLTRKNKPTKRTGQPVLPTVVQLFPELKKIKEEDQGPSCSLAEALNRQDLFINSTLAQLGAGLLWKLFRNGMILHHGCYLNLETMCVNPIPVK